MLHVSAGNEGFPRKENGEITRLIFVINTVWYKISIEEMIMNIDAGRGDGYRIFSM